MTLLSPPIAELLNAVRRRIRGYVLWEGAAVAVIWLVATFWIGLALDYLPVRMGANEMPRTARVVLLGMISITLAVILYHYVLRRVFASLRDESLALLIERKFPQFRDSLITVVQGDAIQTSIPPYDRPEQSLAKEMQSQALRHVEETLSVVDIDRVFDFRPLRRRTWTAATFLASVLIFALTSWPACGLWISRLYGLSERPYPRQTRLTMEGFEDGTVTVARGSDLSVRVLADAERAVPPPELCTIYYETAEGERGRVNMSKKGAPRNGSQQYTFDGKPFKSLLSDITFDVIGNDGRIRDQRVRTVDSPQVVAVELECTRPAYTDLSPIRLDYYPGIKIPQGSSLRVVIKTNKPLVQAERTDGPTEPSLPDNVLTLLPSADHPDSQTIEYRIASLDENATHEVQLLDRDGVRSQRPYRIALVAVPDFAPTVAIRLRGIGSAITADARLPIEGEIKDDYGIRKSWFEIELSNDDIRAFPLAAPRGNITESLDLRAQRGAAENGLTIPTDSRFVFSVKSADTYDLGDAPNVGQSDRYELQVVTANELMALLEARELGLRRRFEQIIDEMTESRDSLQRVANATVARDTNLKDKEERESAADGDGEEGGTSGNAQRAATLRMLRVQRGEQQSQRGAAEVMGVALSFEDISLELLNNRVDANDRVERIERDISTPLRTISTDQFPQADERLKVLRRMLESGVTESGVTESGVTESGVTESQISEQTAATVAAFDEILVAMEGVLSKMLDLETYNELVDLIRSMIKDQEDLTERTKSERKKSTLELLK